jgi:hypothetical protein
MDNQQPKKQPPPLIDFTDPSSSADLVQLPQIGGEKLEEKMKNFLTKLFQQESLSPHSIKIEIAIVAGVSILSALITDGISSIYTNFLNIICGNGGIEFGSNCPIGSFSAYLFTFLVVGFATGTTLKLLRIRHAYLLALFSTFSLIPTYYLRHGLSYYPLAIITTSLIFYYLLIYQFYNVIFNVLSHKFSLAVVTSSFTTLGCLLFLPSLGLFLDDQGFFHKGDAKLAAIDFRIYAPARSVGRFTYKGYTFNYFSDPSFIQYHFSPTMTAYVYKTPSYFKPPSNCGLPHPDRTVDQAGIIPFPCPLARITPQGRPIYAYSTSYQNNTYNPTIAPDTYYTQIGNTVISFDDISSTRATLSEMVALIDSLQPVSANELKKINSQ